MTPDDGEDGFFPRGATASFLAMIVVYLLLWLLMYGLMAYRG